MFLLVPAHTGCPRQSPESCKMVVIVVVMALDGLLCIDVLLRNYSIARIECL